MTTNFDYTKLIVENINKIMPAVLLLITGLTSAFGYVVTDNWNNEEEKNKAIHEVTKGFQSVLAEKQDEPQVKLRSCENCGNIVINAIKKHEKGRLH